MKQQVSLQLVAETDIEATSCRTGKTKILTKLCSEAIVIFSLQ